MQWIEDHFLAPIAARMRRDHFTAARHDQSHTKAFTTPFGRLRHRGGNSSKFAFLVLQWPNKAILAKRTVSNALETSHSYNTSRLNR